MSRIIRANADRDENERRFNAYVNAGGFAGWTAATSPAARAAFGARLADAYNAAAQESAA